MVQTGGKVTCRNSKTARTLFRVSVLRPAPSSCRNSMTARTLFRASVLWWAASSCRDHGSNRGRRPRVAIAGSNRGFSRLGWSADPTLLSLLWYKPGVRLPPRVANVVQTRGETLAGKWWMCQYPYDKNTGVRTMVQTGGKVTCTSWVSQPWCEVQPLVSQLDDAARTRTRCCPVGGRVHA